MKKLTLDEIHGLERYEQLRAEIRARVIDLKRDRRVGVGDKVTFVFENHDTMLFQVHEMLRAERTVDIDKIREEIETYNALIPDASELSATMLIEITDGDRVREELVSLIGIDEAVGLEIGPTIRVRATFEPGRSKEEKLSAVQYVRFHFTPEEARAFCTGELPIRLVIDHPNYKHATRLSDGSRASLALDLSAA